MKIINKVLLDSFLNNSNSKKKAQLPIEEDLNFHTYPNPVSSVLDIENGLKDVAVTLRLFAIGGT